jgi:hypothetical protein
MGSSGSAVARFAVFGVVFLSACAVVPPQQALAKLANIDSPIELGRAVAMEQVQSAETGFGVLEWVANPLMRAPLQSLRAGQVQEGGGFRFDTQRWCGGSGDIWGATTQSFATLCTRKGGSFDAGFCSKAGERDSVLFMAKVWRSHNSFCPAEVQIAVAEPTASLQAPGYVEMLVKAGFETSTVRQARLGAVRAEQQVAAQRRQAEVEAERRRLVAELPQMKRRGTQVCTEEGNTTWLGFVEDEANGKLKILLNRGYLTRTPSVTVKVPASNLVWEFPDRWRLC